MPIVIGDGAGVTHAKHGHGAVLAINGMRARVRFDNGTSWVEIKHLAMAEAGDQSADVASGSSTPAYTMADTFEISEELMSNVGSEAGSDFLEQAQAAAAERAAQGYDEEGSCGGPFTEHNPPPGKAFESYKKGCIGINWKSAAELPMELRAADVVVSLLPAPPKR